MRSVQDVTHRLNKAKQEYLREVAACDRELQGIVRIDPSHLKAAERVQGDFVVDTVDILQLKANEQPRPADEKKAKK